MALRVCSFAALALLGALTVVGAEPQALAVSEVCAFDHIRETVVVV